MEPQPGLPWGWEELPGKQQWEAGSKWGLKPALELTGHEYSKVLVNLCTLTPAPNVLCFKLSTIRNTQNPFHYFVSFRKFSFDCSHLRNFTEQNYQTVSDTQRNSPYFPLYYQQTEKILIFVNNRVVVNRAHDGILKVATAGKVLNTL